MRGLVLTALAGATGLALGCGTGAGGPTPAPQPQAADTTTATPAPAGEPVLNPLYAGWANFKPGTAVTHRSVTESAEFRTVTTTTYTLRERTDEQVVVEMKAHTRRYDGTELDNPPETFTHKKTITLPPGIDRAKFGQPAGAGEPLEVVTAGGREYKARRSVVKDRSEAGESVTETWSSDEVPGRFVKSVGKVPAIKATTTVEVVEVRVP